MLYVLDNNVYSMIKGWYDLVQWPLHHQSYASSPTPTTLHNLIESWSHIGKSYHTQIYKYCGMVDRNCGMKYAKQPGAKPLNF